MQARKIIIIHPGSLNLRIGRAGDLNPVTVLHAIARLRKPGDHQETSTQFGCHHHRDGLLPSLQVNDEKDRGVGGQDLSVNFYREFETDRAEISSFVQQQIIQEQRESAGTTTTSNKSSRNSGGTSRAIVLPQLNREEILNYNRSQKPSAIEAHQSEMNVGEQNVVNSVPLNETQGTPVNNNGEKEVERTLPSILFDRDILKLTPKESRAYNIHFPYRRGDLNIHDGIGGSVVSVMADLEAIWSYVLQEHLQIHPKAIAHYGAVLIIPEVYNRSYLKEIVTLLLQRLHFQACFLVQDHVAATFGACFGFGCVVDMGHQKCSISCVEDGISQVDTRVRLGYGGGDLTQLLHFLLKKCGFPYEDCDPMESIQDAVLMQRLKEQLCHLSFTLDAMKTDRKQHTLQIEEKGLRYEFKMDDEGLITPLALFYTKLLYLTEKRRPVRMQLRASEFSDAEDCFDGEYLRETSRVRNGRIDQLLDGGNGPVTGDTGDDDMVGVVDTYEVDERNHYERTRANEKEEQQNNLYFMGAGGTVAPLDLAIIQSIERCPTEDMKRKMYSSILLVGGGSKIPGLRKFLEQRIVQQLNQHQRSPMEVNVFNKEMDASIISWKGAAIMSCLESAPELWIMAIEWEKYGLRVLREKAIFNW